MIPSRARVSPRGNIERRKSVAPTLLAARARAAPPLPSSRSVDMAFPKKLSAYMTFSNANRERVRDELIASGHDKPTIADIARAISVEWNAKTDEEKTVRAMRCPRRRTRDSKRAIARPRARRDALIG